MPVGCDQVADARRSAAQRPGPPEAAERVGHGHAVDSRRPERGDALRARLDPDAAVRGAVEVVRRQRELKLRKRRVTERDAAAQDHRLAAVRVAERHRLVVVERRAEDRDHPDVVAAHGDREREVASTRQRLCPERHAPRRCHPASELVQRERCEVAAPAAGVGEARRRQAEHRERGAARDVAGQAQHAFRSRRVRGCRSAVQDRDEL